MTTTIAIADHAIRRRQRLDKALSRMTRLYKIRKSQGRDVRHLLARCRVLSEAWLAARNDELMS